MSGVLGFPRPSLPALVTACLSPRNRLVGVKWHLTVVLMYTVLMTKGIEHLFTCVLAIRIVFAEMCIPIPCLFFN